MNELMRWIGDLQARIERLESLESGASSGGWTPTLTGSVSSGTFTYAVRVGYYVKQGNLVWLYHYVALNSLTVSPSGAVQITGVPFPAVNSTNLFAGSGLSQFSAINLSAGSTQLAHRITHGTSVLDYIQSGSGVSNTGLNGAALTANSSFIGTLLYQTD